MYLFKTNNKAGWMEVHDGDGLVLGQPKARGTVQPQIVPTLNTSTGGGSGVFLILPPTED